ncbi:MAG: VOC family protein [Cyanobacteria bacterium P01_A01_bin.114]
MTSELETSELETFEIDHLFVWSQIDAPEASYLIDAGLSEGPANVHPGQGTANRRFFFANAMLELLWVQDDAEARSALVHPLRLWERWQRQGQRASPFGIAFRPAGPKPEHKPFPGFPYTPGYLPAPLSIWIGENAADIAEPLTFYLDFANSQAAKSLAVQPDAQIVTHPIGVQSVTAVSIYTPQTTLSETLQTAVSQVKALQFLPSEQPCLEIEFDQAQQGQSVDFMPHLPLKLRW